MFSIRDFFALGFLSLFLGPTHAENTLALTHDHHGNQWFITRTSAADGTGRQAAHLRVDFSKPRSFRSYHQVKSAFLAVRYSCSQEIIEIERINLLGESGNEIAKIPAIEPSLSAAQHLPVLIVKSVFTHACAEGGSQS